MRHTLALALLFLTSLGAKAETAHCDTNKMLQTTQKLVQFFFYNHDKTTLDSILSDNAKLTFNINGKKSEKNKKDYSERVMKSLTENITSSRPTSISYEITGPSVVKMTAKMIETRKGEGIEEAGPGMYLVNLTGYYTFQPDKEDMKIIKFHHNCTKTKLN